MNNQNEILNWVQKLPDWQGVIAIRFLRGDQVSEKDEDDAIRHLKYSKKITQEVFILEHSTSSFPSPDSSKMNSDNVVLLSLSNLSNVNAIAEDQTLTFNPSGLTTIYGDNGTGKSGYSRVLKRACWARDDKSPILGNVFSETKKQETSARIEFKVNGESRIFNWVDGKESTDSLQNVAVFDTECARWYTNEKGETRYLPYGMDLFSKLAAFCDRIKAKLIAETPQSLPLPRAIQLLSNDKTLGGIIDRIKNGDEKILSDPLFNLTPEESSRLQTLDIEMKMKTKDAITKEINSLHEKIRRISEIKMVVEQATKSLSSDSIDFVNSNIVSYESSAEALKLSRDQVFDSEYLPGTGSEPWKILYEAAREFSGVAYPDKEFPVIDEESRCPLCQQYLDSKAKKRFESFKSYVEDFATENEQKAKLALDASKQHYIKLRDKLENCDYLPIEETMEDENIFKNLKKRHLILQSSVDDVVTSIEQRAAFTVTAPDLKIEQEIENTVADVKKDISQKGELLEDEPSELRASVTVTASDLKIEQEIESIIADVRKDISQKRELLEDESRKKLENERQNLKNRELLHDHLEAIKDYINNVNLKRSTINVRKHVILHQLLALVKK